MKIKILFILFFLVSAVPYCSGLTLFETFEYDVIANTADSWSYLFESSAAGGIAHNSYGQYISCGLQRDNIINTTCRLYMNLGTTYNSANPLPECWLEYDYRTHSNNANTGHSFIGLLDSSSRVYNMNSSNYLYLAMASNSIWNSSCSYNTSPSSYGVLIGTGTTCPWTVYLPYRVKAHIYREYDAVKIAVFLYQLGGADGNQETLVASNPVVTMIPRFNYLYSGINAIGVGNTRVTNTTSLNYFDLDNLYFSTEGPNAGTLTPFTRQAAGQVPPEMAGLVGWWRFDSTSDLTFDSSGNDNEGQIVGDCSYTSDAFAGGGAVQFNGGYIRLYSCSNEGFTSKFSNGSATVAAWLKLDSANPVWPGNGFANIGTWCYPSVYPSSPGALSLKMFLSDGEPVIVTLPPGVILTQWHHLAATVNGNNMEAGYKVYFDGDLIGQFPMDGTHGQFLPADKPLIGACFDTASNTWSYMYGKIDELYIYNRVLNAEEINSLVHFSDFDYSGQVTQTDLELLVYGWLQNCSSPDWCSGTDINRDSMVNFKDFVVFAEQWMQIVP